LAADEALRWRDAYEERAAIMEYDGGMTRHEAEAAARTDLLALGAPPAAIPDTSSEEPTYGSARPKYPSPDPTARLTDAPEPVAVTEPPGSIVAGSASATAERKPASGADADPTRLAAAAHLRLGQRRLRHTLRRPDTNSPIG
jgi:hypothetical protein